MKSKKNTGRYIRITLGFDASEYDRSTGYWHIACSRCMALVINGVPCHEYGCSNKRYPRRTDDEKYYE